MENLFSKEAHFKRDWLILKVLSHPCPLDSKKILFEVSKKLQCVSVTQGVEKLQLIKIRVIILAKHNFAAL